MIRRPWAWPAALMLPVLVYLAVAWVDGGLTRIGPPQTDYYNRLVHGFRKGHLYLDAPVAPELLQCPNPFDPANRRGIPYLHDASLYHHRYYIYFGVTPLCTLLLPFNWLTGVDLPIGYAVWLFVSAGYVAAAILLRHTLSRCCPDAGPGVLAIAYGGLAFSGAELTLLARHSLYELPIAAGSAFFLASLIGLFRSLEARRSITWAAAAGFSLGLAVGCRPFYLFGTLLFIVPLISAPRRNGYGWRHVAAAAAACGFIGLLLAAYNHARFGNVFEFGQSYMLTGAIEAQARHFSARYIPFNVRVYLFAPLRWSRYFPFVHGIAAPTLPAGFGGLEWSYGIIPNAPFTLFAAAGLGLARRDIRMTIVGASAAAFAGFFCTFFGSVGRYLGDFMPEVGLLAAVGYVALATAQTLPDRLRDSVATLGAALAGATAVVALLLSLVMYQSAARWSPKVLHKLTEIGNGPVAGLEALAGFHGGPLELTLTLPKRSESWEPLLVTGLAPDQDEIWIRRFDSGDIQLAYRQGRSGAEILSPPLAPGPPSAHRLTLGLGCLYPPPEHPFFRHVSPERVRSVKCWLRLEWDGRVVCERSTAFAATDPDRLWIGSDPTDPARTYSGHIIARRRVAPQWRDGAPYRLNLEVRPHLDPGWIGRRFPLVTAGAPADGDALVIEVASASAVRFGFDRWGGTMLWSPAIPWDFHSPPTLELTVPGYLGSKGSTVPGYLGSGSNGNGSTVPGYPRSTVPGYLGSKEFSVSAGGIVLWRGTAPVFPRSEVAVFPGVNAIGASTCEALLPESSGTEVGRH